MDIDKKINILALSGSLRKKSSSIAVLKSLSGLAITKAGFKIYDTLDGLPHFSPDREEGTQEVNDFRHALQEADGIVICTPEYAFGVPGTLKNALDWVVSSGELNEKPVIAISVSPLPSGGDKALASLLLTLSALGTRLDAEAALSIPVINKKLN
jgi:chromate reductase